MLGCGCLEGIRYFDTKMPGSKGTIKTISDAICLHEEDYGIAWKHKDWRIEEVEARSSRLLTIFSA
ncbi:hypothetical protein COK01_17740 [Priestia megaterium]|jgi:primary-amine oxidase|uniref:Amine oxidase n=1 Tax=Priestia megaterium TaxID=1404 RepID=A0AAE5P3Y4_PRIMG|nr:hypothetical protein [Priestia megaterium]RFB30412.1 hypothetical protein DZB87_08070 [Bacillus sp. ALD]RFB40187.1 hypothetical protein DZB86_04890 [Bacillus sp. RC]MBV6735974.1 hypothetical protein [Priestia megaterium]MCA4156335.1 hypothetical protein [Priestia megaterium]